MHLVNRYFEAREIFFRHLAVAHCTQQSHGRPVGNAVDCPTPCGASLSTPSNWAASRWVSERLARMALYSVAVIGSR